MTTRIRHLYIHVPFCSSICHYCDFCHRVYDQKTADRWLGRLKKEIDDNCHDQYETIYIGGGTPSVLSNGQLKSLFELLGPYTQEVREYTIEVNPESLDADKIRLFKQYGINRVSMGIQSADDELLQTLNRKHSFEDAKRAVGMLKENGLENVSVDLMYSLPGQTMDILKKTLDDILELDVPHISLYSLTVEENTVFGKKGMTALDEDIEADMYELIVSTLEKNGYLHYEVSNFCKPGQGSLHNMGYWDYDDFLGLSLGASGKIGNRRYTNTRSFERYFGSEDIRDEDLTLSREDMMFENIMMSLRTSKGLNIQEFNVRYDTDFLERYEKALKKHKNALVIDSSYIKVRELALLHPILIDFMD